MNLRDLMIADLEFVRPKEWKMILIRVPADFKREIEAFAKKNKVSIAAVFRVGAKKLMEAWEDESA